MSDARSTQLNQIARFSSSELARFLTVVSLELTISARETYVPGSMEMREEMRDSHRNSRTYPEGDPRRNQRKFRTGTREEAGATGRGDATWDASDNINQEFTGKERDAESGLDYFGARYYGSATKKAPGIKVIPR